MKHEDKVVTGKSRDQKRRWNKKTVKQMGISRDKKSRWNKKTVKQMGISRDKKSRWNKKTVKQMGLSRQEEDMEHEDRIASSYKLTRRVE